MTEIEVVLVLYRSATSVGDLIARNLELLSRSQRFAVTIVDNTAGLDRAEFTARYPEQASAASWLVLDNPGFATACNAAARLGDSPWLLFLNPDAALSPDDPPRLLAAVRDAQVDMFALVMRTGRLEHCGVGETGWHWFRDRPTNSRVPPLGPSGGAGLYRRSTFLDLGGYQASLFAWGEDAAFAYRARRQGLICGEIGTNIAHLGGHSLEGSRAMRRRKAFLLNRNRALVARDALSPWGYAGFALQHAVVLALLTPRYIRRRTAIACWRGLWKGYTSA